MPHRRRVRAADLAGDPAAAVETVTQQGPVTHRLNEPAEGSASYLAEHHVDSVLFTTSDGELVGIFYRDYRANPAYKLVDRAR